MTTQHTALMRRALLEHHAPTAALVDHLGMLRAASGALERYLDPEAATDAPLDQRLLPPLRALARRLLAEPLTAPSRAQALLLTEEGVDRVTLEVSRLEQGHRLLVFQRAPGWRMDEALGRFAHELRTPMATLTNAAALLENPALAKPDLALVSGVVTRQTRRLSQYIDLLSWLSRLSRGTSHGEATPLDLGDLLRSILDARRTTPPFRAELPTEPLLVKAAPNLLNLLLTTLLQLAEEGGWEAPRLRVARSSANRAQIAARATDAPIEATTRHHLAPHLSRSTHLRLTLLGALVELLGGDLHTDDTTPPDTVVITLPCDAPS